MFLLTFAGPVRRGVPPAAPGRLRRAAGVAADLLGVVGVAFFIPFVILAITLPIGLCAWLVSWLVGMF